MWATGNIILRRLSEISTEIEITAEGDIVARIPGQEIEGRGRSVPIGADLYAPPGRSGKIFMLAVTSKWEEEGQDVVSALKKIKDI